MASAWGASWGSAWGNSWGSVGAVVTPEPPSVGSSISGGTFSRKRWRELKDAWEAQAAAEMAAAELKAKTKRKVTLAKAARLAEAAINQAHADERIRVGALTRALEAAADATKAAIAIREAQHAIAISLAIIRDQEDEDELLHLLLSI
jgi:L-lactate utilization protein LutC